MLTPTTAQVVDDSYYYGWVVDWLFAVGYPINEPYWTRCTVAGEERDMLVQLFERWVLAYTTPPANPSAWRVEMGNAGWPALLHLALRGR